MPLPIPPQRAASVLVLVLVLAFAACRTEAPSKQGAAAAGSAEPFLRTPAVSHLTLSPDGKRIAGLSSNEGVQVVFETTRSPSQVNYLTKIAPATVIESFGWSGDDVLVVGYEQPDASLKREAENRRSPEGVVFNAETPRVRRERARENRMIELRAGNGRQHA